MRTFVSLAFVMLFFDKVQAKASSVKKLGDVVEDATPGPVRSSTDPGEIKAFAEAMDENWVVNDKWPQCTEIFDRVGNSRNSEGVSVCGNDWAHSGVTVLNSLMCIATNGRLKVRSSVGWVTQCNAFPDVHPCVLGTPMAVQLFAHPQFPWNRGEPPVAQCYDYTPSMEAAVSCPENPECNQQKWRDKFPQGVFDDARVKWQHRLQEEYFINSRLGPAPDYEYIPLSLYYTTFHHDDSNPDSPSLEQEFKMTQMRVFMYNNGPVDGGVHVPLDANGHVRTDTPFYSYTDADGVYSHESACSDAGNYAVVVKGWGKDSDGKDYFVVQNNYGEDWGNRGTMKVLPCGMHMWIGLPTISTQPDPLIIEEEEVDRVVNMMAIYNDEVGPASSEIEEDGALVAIAPPRASFAAGVLLAMAAVP